MAMSKLSSDMADRLGRKMSLPVENNRSDEALEGPYGELHQHSTL